MSILIKGMEMPKGRPVCIVIDAAGQARRYDLNNDRYADDKLFEAVPVPPHGRLIDADAEIERVQKLYDKAVEKDPEMGCVNVYEGEIAVLQLAPTIIPTEEGET